MATLNYLRRNRRSSLVASISVHLLVWSILHFILAFVVGAYIVCSLVVMGGEIKGMEFVTMLAIDLALPGSVALLFVLLGRLCLRARRGAINGEWFDLISAERLFGAYMLLSGFALFASVSFLVTSLRDSGFWIAVFCAVFSLSPVVLVGWTRYGIRATLSEFKAESQRITSVTPKENEH